MYDQELVITFGNASHADAARFAQGLEQAVRETVSSVKTSLEKVRPDSQDFGSVLVLVFGTPVAIELARAVTTFLMRTSGASITITRAGTVVAKNLDSGDAAKIAEAFAGKTREHSC